MDDFFHVTCDDRDAGRFTDQDFFRNYRRTYGYFFMNQRDYRTISLEHQSRLAFGNDNFSLGFYVHFHRLFRRADDDTQIFREMYGRNQAGGHIFRTLRQDAFGDATRRNIAGGARMCTDFTAYFARFDRFVCDCTAKVHGCYERHTFNCFTSFDGGHLFILGVWDR